MAKQSENILLKPDEYNALLKQAAEYAQLMEKFKQAEQARLQAEQARLQAEEKAAQLTLEKIELEQKLAEEKALLSIFVQRLLVKKSERYKAKPLTEEEAKAQMERILRDDKKDKKATPAAASSPAAPAVVETEKAEKAEQPEKKKRNHPGRNPIPDHLPRVDVILEPKEDVKGWKKMAPEITEELEYVPGYFFVRRFIRYKYIRPENNDIVIAPLPIRVIDKGIPGPMLVAFILISKYLDHLPLHRQLSIFKRAGIVMNDMTFNGWARQGMNHLQALHARMRKEIMDADYLMADETTIRVMDGEKKGTTHQGYYWAYLNPKKRGALFIYEKGRGSKYVQEHLKAYRGFLQTDAYSAYDTLVKQNKKISLLGCWAHVRRKFMDALEVDKEQAEWFVLKIQQLYMIERFARRMKLTEEERLELRGHAKPILEELKTRMTELASTLPPRNLLSVAVRYALNNWEELLVYTTDGRFEIDNNLVENSIRPIALGRKNYLFAGNHEAAQRGAIMYSILASCKANDINPLEYLADVLDRIVTRDLNNIDDLLPWNWVKQHNKSEEES